MTENIKETIYSIFLEVFAKEANGLTPPKLNDKLILLDCGLDSMGFAILIVKLEDKLGFDPFTISDEAFYPSTLGEFIAYYEKYKPK